MHRYRFIARQDGIEKSLFLLEERNTGDVLIHFSLAQSLDGKTSKGLKFTRRSMTIHPSKESDPPVKTITNKIYLGTRLVQKDYGVFSVPPEENYAWPVTCDVVGSTSPVFRTSQVQKRDKVVKLASYLTARETMFYALIVTKHGYSLPAAFGFSSFTCNFSHFDLTILYNFADIRSPKTGFYHIRITSDSIIPGTIPMIGSTRDASESTTTNNLELVIQEGFYSLAGVVQKNTNRESLVFLRPRIPQFRRFPAYWPNGISAQDGQYGVNSIFRAQRQSPQMRMNPEHIGDPRFSQRISPMTWSYNPDL